jgi:uncharacterized protein with LGFP repeats
MSAIDDKWQQCQWLGAPVDEGAGSAEMTLRDGRGRARDYQNGSIYWTPELGAFEVHGAIRVKWAQLGGERGVLGYPVTDELGCGPGNGRYNHFQGGSIYWTPELGAHEVHAQVRDKWAQLGWQSSTLGYPTGDVRSEPGRLSGSFQNGSIVWTPAGGAVVAQRID